MGGGWDGGGWGLGVVMHFDEWKGCSSVVSLLGFLLSMCYYLLSVSRGVSLLRL